LGVDFAPQAHMPTRFSFAAICALVVLFSPFSFGGPVSCGEAYDKLNHLIERNFFETRRTIEKYIELFPDEFSEELSRLDKSGHWLDAGSGEAFAVQDFFRSVPLEVESFLKDVQRSVWKAREIKVDPDKIREIGKRLSSRSPSDRPQVTAVTFAMERSDPLISGLQIKTGRFFEDIPTGEFKSADIITDLFGVASYSPKVDEVFRRYHEILKTGGKAFIYIGDFVESPRMVGLILPEPVGERGWDSAFERSKVITAQGERVSLLDWVQKLPGFKATILSREVQGSRQGAAQPAIMLRSTLVLEKVGEVTEVPLLRLIETTEDKPPIRIFQEISLSNQ